MFIKLDENKYIQGYAVVGGIIGAVEVDLDENKMPKDYLNAYQYIDGKIILDEAKLEELKEIQYKSEQNNEFVPMSEVDELKKKIAALEEIIAKYFPE